MVLGAAACVLFVGGTFRPNRCLWGWVALISLGLSGLGLWQTARTVPTVESTEAKIAAEVEKQRREAPGGEAKELDALKKAHDAEKFSAPLQFSRIALFVKLLALIV